MKQVLSTHIRQIVFFGIVGSIGATIDLGTFILYSRFFSFPIQISFLYSSLTAMIFVFCSNKFFTFRNHEKTYVHQSIKFFSVYILASFMNAALSTIFLWLGSNAVIAKIISILCIALFNYTGSHFFIFKRTS